MTAAKTKTTGHARVRSRKTTVTVTEWEISPLMTDLIERAQYCERCGDRLRLKRGAVGR
jgi:hypothetical protein